MFLCIDDVLMIRDLFKYVPKSKGTLNSSSANFLVSPWNQLFLFVAVQFLRGPFFRLSRYTLFFQVCYYFHPTSQLHCLLFYSHCYQVCLVIYYLLEMKPVERKAVLVIVKETTMIPTIIVLITLKKEKIKKIMYQTSSSLQYMQSQ